MSPRSSRALCPSMALKGYTPALSLAAREALATLIVSLGCSHLLS